MSKIITQKYQTLWDIALQAFGRSDSTAILKILDDNPNLYFSNEDTEEGNVGTFTENDISRPLLPNQNVFIDDDFEKEQIIYNKMQNQQLIGGYAEKT